MTIIPLRIIRRLALICLGAIACWPSSLCGDIVLPKIFSDHMVLQQNQSMRVWGRSDPGEKLTVTFDAQTLKAVADGNGNWSTLLSTGPAGGPYELSVASDDSETSVVFHDVLVGEVWLCAGQSNMKWPVIQTGNADAEIEMATQFPAIRLFDVQPQASPEPLSELSRVQPWYCCNPESIGQFSAVGYFFARELSRHLDVPIGLINVSRDGTTLESWTPRNALEDDGTFDALLNHWIERKEPANPNRVSNSYNAMVAPLRGFAFRGIIWYQGEANVGRGAQYGRMFPLLIDSWRKKLKQKDCPFLFVQPAPYRYTGLSPAALPEIWDAQLATYRNVENTGMVVTADIGDPAEFHPDNKQIIAQRLSLWALAGCYAETLARRQVKSAHAESGGTDASVPPAGATTPVSDGSSESATTGGKPPVQGVELSGDHDGTQQVSRYQPGDIVCSGPIYQSHRIENSHVVISFEFAQRMEIAQGETGFTICGRDRQFIDAVAVVDGETVVVSSPEIDEPVAVRYDWSNTPNATLTNEAALPASPFRTDNFPLTSAGIEF